MPGRCLIFLLGLLLQSQVSAEASTVHVLAYHDVRDRVIEAVDPDAYAISTANLIDHFHWLREHGYTPISVETLLAARDGNARLPDKPVLLTFDDGFTSAYTHVFPLLKQFEYPAIVSIVTAWLEQDPEVVQGGRLLRREDFLSWPQIVEMQASGLVEIASHSHDLHRGVPGNPAGNLEPAAVTLRYSEGRYESIDAYRERITSDLAQSATIIASRTGRAPRVVTWPFGEYNSHTMRAAAAAGMPIGLTLDDGAVVLDDLGALPRHLIQNNAGIEALATSLLYSNRNPIVRAAQVDLDYVYDPDVAQQEANLGRLLDRIQALQISHVYLQAFADPDADGGAQSLYFPNRHLPMRADLFNRAAWQLSTRAGVAVYAWLPLLSFEGQSVDPAWRVLERRSSAYEIDPDSEPRLSPFEPAAVALIGDIYQDLARHAHFAGLLFHDDGRFNAEEDASPAALAAYRDAFGASFAFERLDRDPVLRTQWAALRSKRLIDLSLELTQIVRDFRPRIKTVRNIFAPAVYTDRGALHYAQSYDAFLAAYDHVAVMAMPYLEGVDDPEAFYGALVAAVSARPEGLARTIFELQTVDWRSGRAIPDARLFRTLRGLQARGVRHLAYYPDDFISGRPDIDALRRGMSLATFPRGR